MKHLRKKAGALLLAGLMTGCAARNMEERSAETQETTPVVEIDIFADNPNPAYMNAEFREEDGGVGEPQTYEDLQDFLNPEKMNFLAFRILGVYSPEEAYEITGDELFYDLTTLYKAVLTYDHLKNEPVEIEVNIAKAGTPQQQFEGFPPYEIGGEYAAYFTDMDFGETWQVACPELLFTLKSDGAREYALQSQSVDFITAEGASLDLGIEGGEISVITSTGNNPVKYVHKYDVGELVEFFREDWTARGYTFAKIEKPAEIDIFADNPNPAYTNAELREEDGGSGEPQTYEDLRDYLNPEKMNFLAFRILGVYSPEEAYEITGNDIYIRDLTTLYKAVLTYDYLKNEPANIDVNISKAGTPQKQLEGFPPYEIGGEYAAYFTNMDLNAPRLVACPELLFTLKSDGTREYALHSVSIDFITSEGISLDLGIEGGEISVITSTGNNPVKYIHKYDLEELAVFFREDWTARGYTFAKIEKTNGMA